jgi:hypothetical protein
VKKAVRGAVPRHADVVFQIRLSPRFFRPREKGMSWSLQGGNVLVILKVIELNGQWEQFGSQTRPPLEHRKIYR